MLRHYDLHFQLRMSYPELVCNKQMEYYYRRSMEFRSLIPTFEGFVHYVTSMRQRWLPESLLDELQNKWVAYINQVPNAPSWDKDSPIKTVNHIQHSESVHWCGDHYCFTVYNLLGAFHGHYNIQLPSLSVMDYSVCKKGSYGGLTHMSPSDDVAVYKREQLSLDRQITMDACVAKTLWLFLYGPYSHLIFGALDDADCLPKPTQQTTMTYDNI